MISLTAQVLHGRSLTQNSLIGLARSIVLDTTQLERHALPSPNNLGVTFSVFKIPRAAIVDVVGVRQPPELETNLGAYRNGMRVCEPMASRTFERAESRLYDTDVPQAISRRSLGLTPDGREILQRTQTSARDFVLANPLLRSLRK